MIRKGLCAVAAAVLAWTPAQAATRMLFVGIDSYKFGVPGGPGCDPDKSLCNLRGAVGDVGRIKAVLADKATYRLDVDTTPLDGRTCTTGNPVSITLVNACATRRGILDSFGALINAASAGDVILFYYAGHGSRSDKTPDDQLVDAKGEKANSTLVPFDARGPVGQSAPDILDSELKLRIDAAEAKGVNVVTIFDSCHSGTATRDIDGTVRAFPRAAPLYNGPLPQAEAFFAKGSAAAAGYRVNFAASDDTETSNEVPVLGSDGQPTGAFQGVFTRALVTTLRQGRWGRNATYSDIQAEVVRNLIQTGDQPGVGLKIEAQHSRAEGALNTGFLNPVRETARTFDAVAGGTVTGDTITGRGGSITINGGSIAGVTVGSIYKIYPSQGDWHANAQSAVASGTVTLVTPYTAVLKVDRALPLQDSFVVEFEHNYGSGRLKLRIESDDARATAAIAAELAPLNYICLVDVAPGCGGDGAPQYRIVVRAGRISFVSRTGGKTVSAAAYDPGRSPHAIAMVAQKAANYFQLRDFYTDKAKAWGAIAMYPAADSPDQLCRINNATISLAGNQPCHIDVWMKNNSKQSLHPYVLLLNVRNFQVSTLYDGGATAGGGLLPPGRWNKVPIGGLSRPGYGALLLLLTEAPIDIGVLRQDRARDVAAAPAAVHANRLERLLRNASAGQRGEPTVNTGDFGAVLLDFKILGADGKAE